MATNTPLAKVLRELAALEQPTMREANERRGDDHGINLTHLRALAKRLKTQHELTLALWATGDTGARLLATLICRPKVLSAAELDAMVRDIRSPKLLDWLIVNVVKPGRHAEELRLRWKDGGDLVGRAGWSLTTVAERRPSSGAATVRRGPRPRQPLCYSTSTAMLPLSRNNDVSAAGDDLCTTKYVLGCFPPFR